jgi:hypothetical protein
MVPGEGEGDGGWYQYFGRNLGGDPKSPHPLPLSRRERGAFRTTSYILIK